MDYDTMLAEQFGSLTIRLVKHDASWHGLPAYIEVELGKTPKDKGQTALDFGNYLYRIGFRCQSCPEYRGRGKKTTLRYFLSWDQLAPYIPNICSALEVKDVKVERHVPWDFQSLYIYTTLLGTWIDTKPKSEHFTSIQKGA